MGRESAALYTFNRGLISPLALARVDLKRTALSAALMTNWMPRALGSMMLRPGTEYLGSSRSDAEAFYIPFVFSITDKALIEISDSNVRVWVDDALVTRPTVTTSITNGNFTSDLSSWTDADESGAASIYTPFGSYNVMSLAGTGANAAIRYQLVSVAADSVNVEHALRIVVVLGVVTLKVGSSSTSDDYIAETELGVGTHSLAFTPTGNFYVQLLNRREVLAYVDSVNIEGAGVMSITAPWSADDLTLIRHEQSADIVYVACSGIQQHKIERRATRSWSVVAYEPEDGPFLVENVSGITLTPSNLAGKIVLTASAPIFRTTHVGALFKITSEGQSVSSNIASANTFSNSITVTNVGEARRFTIVVSGTWTATVTLQQSLDDGSTWADISNYTSNVSTTYADGLDNQTVQYRIGIKTGNYTSGTAAVTLSYSLGSITGIVRVMGYTSANIVDASVLTALGGTSATDVWSEGAWSDYRGWPSAPAFFDGRLAWAGLDKIKLSVSDGFESFDESVEGDSGPISRTIGSGPVETINWILPLQRLIIGGAVAEYVCKSSSFDEPLTPTNMSVKSSSTQGSTTVGGVKVDKTGIFGQRGGTRVMEIAIEQDDEYGSNDLTILCPEVCQPSVVKIVVQRQPDTRLHCVLSDGTVAVVIYDRAENLRCWVKVETDGLVEDAVVLPGDPGDSEDWVYYLVNRTINGSTKRYLETWAFESECEGATLNRQADCHLAYSGVQTFGISGLSHLEGETVVVWGNGKDLGTYTVSGGAISGLSEAVTSAVVGLGYTANWKSTKLAYGGGVMGTALTQKKKLTHLGVILLNTHYQGLEYGPDFDNLDPLPKVKDGAPIAADTIFSTFDEEPFEFPGAWDTDARLCLRATAPRPCNILAAVIAVEPHEKY